METQQPGTSSLEVSRLSAKAPEIKMNRATWYRILLAARGEKLP